MWNLVCGDGYRILAVADVWGEPLTQGCYTGAATEVPMAGTYAPEFATYLVEVDRGAGCPADLNGDGVVGIADFPALLSAWATDPGGPPDLDGDGTVGVADLLALLAAWGPCVC